MENVFLLSSNAWCSRCPCSVTWQQAVLEYFVCVFIMSQLFKNVRYLFSTQNTVALCICLPLLLEPLRCTWVVFFPGFHSQGDAALFSENWDSCPVDKQFLRYGKNSTGIWKVCLSVSSWWVWFAFWDWNSVFYLGQMCGPELKIDLAECRRCCLRRE